MDDPHKIAGDSAWDGPPFDDLQTLEPGKSVSFGATPNRYYDMSRPGVYSIVAKRLNDELPHEWVYSNEVKVTILSKELGPGHYSGGFQRFFGAACANLREQAYANDLRAKQRAQPARLGSLEFCQPTTLRGLHSRPAAPSDHRRFQTRPGRLPAGSCSPRK